MKKRGTGLPFVYALPHDWRMASTTHVGTKIGDYKDSAYSLTPLDSRELWEF